MNSTRGNLSSLNARSVLHEPSFSAQPLGVCVVGVKCLCSQDSSSVPCITEVFPLQDAFSSLIRAEDFPSRTAFVQKVQRGRAQRSSNHAAENNSWMFQELQRAEAESKLVGVGPRYVLCNFRISCKQSKQKIVKAPPSALDESQLRPSARRHEMDSSS